MSSSAPISPKANAVKEAAWNYKLALYRALHLWLSRDDRERLLRDPILRTAHDELLAAIKAIDADLLKELDVRNSWMIGARLGRLYPRPNQPEALP